MPELAFVMTMATTFAYFEPAKSFRLARVDRSWSSCQCSRGSSLDLASAVLSPCPIPCVWGPVQGSDQHPGLVKNGHDSHRRSVSCLQQGDDELGVLGGIFVSCFVFILLEDPQWRTEQLQSPAV